MNHLPAATRDTFRTLYVPLLREFAGVLGPWQQPTDNDIRNIWYTCFASNSQLELADNIIHVAGKLVSFIFSLIPRLTCVCYKADDRLAEWRNKFASTAMIQLEKSFADLGLLTPKDRAAYVQWLLGANEKCRPFYYKEFVDGQMPIVSHLID
jgi:hypothetical protein